MTGACQPRDGGPLALKLVNHGDGCEAEIKEIRAGEEYELTVRLRGPWRQPQFYNWIELETGVKEAPSEKLTISCRVEGP